jgi:hypothetical protein
MVDGTLPFDEHLNLKDGYRTHGFGLCFNAVVYRNSPVNLQMAFRRQTACRGDTLENELKLRDNMRTTLSTICSDRDWVSLLAKFVMDAREKLGALSWRDHLSSIREFCLQPHKKRKLRLKAYRSLLDLGMFDPDNDLMKNVRLKLKLIEWAKPGKYPRTIGDYSTEGSLFCGYVIDRIKSCLYEKFDFCGMEWRVVPPASHDVLTGLFEDLYKPGNKIFSSSDDSVGRLECYDGTVWVNVDISACDIGNGPEIFEILASICRGDSYLYRIVVTGLKQCAKPLVIRNPHNYRQKLTAMAKHFHDLYFDLEKDGVCKTYSTSPYVNCVEYSGSQFTTLLNCIASAMFVLRISHVWKDEPRYKSDVIPVLIHAAEQVGITISVETVDYGQLQFFKFSPVVIGDAIYPCKNAGTLLRALGSIDHDFPGSSKVPLDLRIEKHTSDVVCGMQHDGNSSLLRALESRFPHGTDICAYTTNRLAPTSKTRVYLGHHPLMQRYRFTISECLELNALIAQLRVGLFVRHRLLDQIYKLDYGYTYPQQ